MLAGRPRVECGLLVTGTAGSGSAFALQTRSVEGFRGQFRRLAARLDEWRAEGFRVRLLAGEAQTAARLREILDDHDLEGPQVTTLFGPEPLAVVVGGAHAGFECPPLGLVCLTETELFGARRSARRRPAYQRGSGLSAFTDLTPGDYVVHVEHGIGRYGGLVTLTVDGQPGDYLVLDYAEGDRLYLPVQRMAAISKYVGAGEASGRIDKLGGASWQKTKESVRAAVRQIAGDLLQLYAARQVLAGSRSDRTPRGSTSSRPPSRSTRRPTSSRRSTTIEAGHGAPAADGPPRVRRRRLRQDRSRDARRVQGGRRTATGRRARPDDGPRPAALRRPSASASPPSRCASRCSRGSAPPKEQKAMLAGLQNGAVDIVIGTHRLLSKDVVVQGPRAPGRRRGAPVRRHAQGAAQAAPQGGRRAHADRDADPAHAPHGARRPPRHVRHRDAARRSPAGARPSSAGSTTRSSRTRSCGSWRAAARSSSSTTASSRIDGAHAG